MELLHCLRELLQGQAFLQQGVCEKLQFFVLLLQFGKLSLQLL